MPRPPVLSRRAAVAGIVAAVAGLVSACTRGGGRPGAGSAPSSGASAAPTGASPTPDPDVALAGAVLAREQALLDRVLATLHAHPTTGAALGSARQAHQAHVRLLAGAVPTPTAGAASATPSPAVSGAPSGTPAPTPAPTAAGTSGPTSVPHQRVHVPAHVPAALAALGGAEQRLAASERDAALRARSGQLARLLAGMAASAAQQSAHLGAAAKEPKR